MLSFRLKCYLFKHLSHVFHCGCKHGGRPEYDDNLYLRVARGGGGSHTYLNDSILRCLNALNIDDRDDTRLHAVVIEHCGTLFLSGGGPTSGQAAGDRLAKQRQAFAHGLESRREYCAVKFVIRNIELNSVLCFSVIKADD